MSVRFLMLALAAAAFAVGSSAQADNARPRSGGSSSSSAGAQHHSGGSDNAHASGSSGGSSGSGSSGSQAAPGGRSVAEQRHPRAGTGTGNWPHHGGGYYPYYPGWYYPYWPSYYGFYAGWGAYGYGYAPGPVYSTYRTGGDSAEVRVLVEPEKAKVYVDGYYAGVVDDFDGMLQRLYLVPGRHEIALKLDGYRTHRLIVYVTPGQSMKIERDLAKGPGDEIVEDLSGGRGAREEVEPRPDRDYDQPPDRGYEPNAEPPASAPRGGDEPYRPDAGRLRLDVRPRDASVYVDGQFQGPAGDVGELFLPPGPHRVEVVRPGFRTEERDVQVAPGSSRTVTIELARP